ncbi:carbohydrate-binding protein [Streptomyces globisporus]
MYVAKRDSALPDRPHVPSGRNHPCHPRRGTSTSPASSSRATGVCGTGDPGPGPGGDSAEAEAYTSSSGVQSAAHGSASGGAALGYIDDGDWAGYSSLDTAGATAFTATVSSAGAGGTIEIRSGSATGPLLGSVDVAPTGGWENRPRPPRPRARVTRPSRALTERPGQPPRRPTWTGPRTGPTGSNSS